MTLVMDNLSESASPIRVGAWLTLVSGLAGLGVGATSGRLEWGDRCEESWR